MARRSGFHCLRLSLCYFRGRVQRPWQLTCPLPPFPRQLWSSVYYLLLVLCAHELITPDCLIICPGCFSFPLQWEIQTMLYLQAFWAALRICLNSEPPNFMKALCEVMLRSPGLPVSNRWVLPRRSDLRQPVCKFTTQLPGRKTFPRRCWGDWQLERRQMSVNPLSHSVWLLP